MAWGTGLARIKYEDRQVIFRELVDGCIAHTMFVELLGVRSPVSRAFAEHEVCCGRARYHDGPGISHLTR